MSLLPISTSIARCFGPTSGLLNRCESEAERVFAGGFIVNEAFEITPAGEAWAIRRDNVVLTLISQHELCLADDPWAKGASPDYVYARPDFALMHDGLLLLLVDIDGHDFHERTKEQIRRDRSRDRQILRCGHKLARFTGSELFLDAKGCAVEAFELALTLGGLSA